jgi:uncharacterized damage-inducible protein DinB
MSLSLTFDELLRYTNAEREKWRAWFGGHAAALEAPVQAGDRFPTVGKLIDHIFLVERRHLQRLLGDPLSDRTGLTGNNAPPLFDYGASVRRELEQYVQDLDDDVADQERSFLVRDQQYSMTPRKLLFHVLLHQLRHWAQIALAVRVAGFEPPGDHDLFFSKALR